MPTDAINAILNGTPAPLHLWVMNETGGTTFADQVSSGNKPLTAGTGCVPNGWGTLAAHREIGGPQTPAPSFDGTSNAYASASGATLGGSALGWGMVCWMNSSATTLANRTLYCERGSSGNDVIRWFIDSSPHLSLTVCDDTAGNVKTAQTPSTSSSVAPGRGTSHNGGQMLGVSVDASGNVSFFLNGPYGVGTSNQTISTSHTWTNTGLTTYVGFDPSNPSTAFNGAIAWVAVFGSPFTADQFNAWYQACTPPPTNGVTWSRAISGAVFPNSQLWNEPLSSSAPVDPNSSAIISQWLAAYSSSAFSFSPYVPMFDLDRVGRGIAGVRSDFQPSADQHAFLLSVPTPDTLLSGDPYPANLSSDAMAWVCQPSTGLQYDIYELLTLQDPTHSAQSVLNAPNIMTVTPSTSSGTLAANTYYYGCTAVNSNGESYGAPSGYLQEVKAVLGGTGKVTLSIWADVNYGTPPPTSWNIYRKTGTGGTYQLVTSVTGWTQGLNTFVDDGSFVLSGSPPAFIHSADSSHPWGQAGAAYTQDWASIAGGGSWDYLKNAAFNPNWRPSGFTNNGASATSSPAGAGVVTLEEGLNGYIPHPIVFATGMSNNGIGISQHRWPAPRHDGLYNTTGFPLYEGMRLRLQAGFNENSLTYSTWTPLATLQKALVVAMRDYGLILRDSTQGAALIYAEETSQTGRDGWAYIAGGRSFGSTVVSSILDPIPWSQLVVLGTQRYPSKTDANGRRSNRLDVAGHSTLVPY